MIFKIYEQVWIKIVAENKEMASTLVFPGYHRVSREDVIYVDKDITIQGLLLGHGDLTHQHDEVA